MQGLTPYEVAKTNRRTKADFFLNQYMKLDAYKKKGFPFNLIVDEVCTFGMMSW